MEKNSKGSILTPILLSAALVLGVVIGLFAGRNSVDRRLRSLAGRTRFAGRQDKLRPLADRPLLRGPGKYRLARGGADARPHVVPRPPLGLYPRLGTGRGKHAARRGIRRHRHHVQHVHRYHHRPECHSAGAEPEGGRTERRPDNPHRRLARGRTETSDGRRDEDAARTARYAGNGIRPAQGNRRPRSHRHRARQDTGEKRGCRLHAHSRHRFPAHHHLLAVHPRRNGTRPRRTPPGRDAQTDNRPARQYGRLPRTTHPHGERIPRRRQAHRLYGRPQRRPDGGVQRRERGLSGCRVGRAHRREQRLLERDIRRGLCRTTTAPR